METPKSELELEVAFRNEFALLSADHTEYPIEATPLSWWCLVCAVQLAARHPEAPNHPTLRIAIEFARAIGEHLATTPALSRVMAQSWQSAYDLADGERLSPSGLIVLPTNRRP